MSGCDFGGMIMLPAKITSLQFEWMLTICLLNSLTGYYTYIHRIMYLLVYLQRYTTGYFHGGPKKYWWREHFPIHEIGRIDGGRGFQTGKHVFRIGRNTFYDRKNKISKKITEFKRSVIPWNSEQISQPSQYAVVGNSTKVTFAISVLVCRTTAYQYAQRTRTPM